MSGDWLRHTYSLAQVECLIGLEESSAPRATRHVTFFDLLSWARDAGGDHTWFQLARQDQQSDAWMARRGPLQPDGELACVLYDLQRGMKELTLVEQGVVALTAAGFGPDEIAAVMDGKQLDFREQHRELEQRRRRIARMIDGRPRRDADGKIQRDDHGAILYTGGVASRLVRLMNKGRAG